MFKLTVRKLEDRGTAMAVSVPIAWVRQNKLKKGDKISIFLDAYGRLVLVAEAKK